MSKSKEVCILPDGRPVKFLLQQRVGRDPFYQVRFVGPDKRRVERSTKCTNLKGARNSACKTIREEYSPKSNFPNIPWDEAIAKIKAAMKAQNLRERSIGEYLAVVLDRFGYIYFFDLEKGSFHKLAKIFLAGVQLACAIILLN